MPRKILSTIIVTLLILFSFSSCKAPGSDARLVLPIDTEPDYLDPQIISDDGARMIMLNCFEGLLTYDGEGNLVPAAAESFEVSSDGLTYTFDLRTDGKWRVTKTAGVILGENYEESFDNRVTANDFVFALQRAVTPSTLCPYASLFINIKNAADILSGKAKASSLGVRADGDYKLIITLERKDDDLLSALASSAALPCNREYFKKTGGRYGLAAAYIISNGPFYFANWAEGTAITIRRNYLYHDLGENAVENEVMPQSVYFSFNSEQATRDRKLRDGTYHLAYLTDIQAEDFSTEKRVEINGFASSMLSVLFNCSDEYMSNINLRRALAHALDRSVFGEKGASPKGLLPSGLTLGGAALGDRKGYALPAGNEKKASSELVLALEELEIPRISITILCDSDDETLARTMIQSWQSAFGVIFGIEVESTDSETLKKRVDSGDYQLALYKQRFSSSIAEAALIDFSSDGRNNHFGFSDAGYDSILEKVFLSGSASKRAKALVNAEKHLTDMAVVIPLAEVKTVYGTNSKCSGIVFSPSGEIAYFKSVLCR